MLDNSQVIISEWINNEEIRACIRYHSQAFTFLEKVRCHKNHSPLNWGQYQNFTKVNIKKMLLNYRPMIDDVSCLQFDSCNIFLYLCLGSFKSAVFILTDQVHSTAWDRWTAQGNSFLQVLCHLLPGGYFNGTDDLRAGNPPHLNKILRYAFLLHCPLIKCLKGTPPLACNVSSHHLSLKF